MKALLVAPHPRSRELLMEALKRRGHEVTVVEDADAAHVALQSGGFRLVVLEADGFPREGSVVCRRLREIPKCGPRVILVVSESHQPEQIQALLAAGADDYLTGLDDPQRLAIRLTVAEHRVRAAEQGGSAEEESGQLQIKRCPVLYHAPYGVVRTSVEGGFLEVNPALVAMLGYDSEEELLGVDLAKDVYRDPALRTQLMAGAADSPGIRELEWKRKDGTPITVRAHGRAICDASGKVVELEGIVEDVTEQKRAEEALKESEQWFRAVFDNAVDGILLADVETKQFHLGNPMICRMLGYSQEEIANLGIRDIHREEDLPNVIAEFEKQVRGEGTLAKDIPVRKRDGSIFFADINSFHITVAGRVYLAGIFRDVTQRKQAEEALRESEERYRQLVEFSPDGVGVAARGKVRFVNPATAMLLGAATPDELVGKSVLDFVHPDYHAWVLESMRKVTEEKRRIFPTETKHVRLDGTSVDLEVAATPITYQGEPAVQVVFRDTAERKRAEQALRKSEATLRGLFENLLDFVITVDRNATIQFVNRGAPGATPEELRGANGFTFIVPEHQQRCREALDQTLETRQTETVEALDIFGHLWFCRLVPVSEEDEVGNVMIICTDITEQKKSTEALQKERQLLRQLLDLHEGERRLMAYEIHDGFSQYLTGAMYNLQGFRELQAKSPLEAWKSFDAGLALIRRSIDEARRLIGGLRPPILDESGIVAAIDYLVCETAESREAEVEFVHDLKSQRLAPPLESAIFRIVQESLTNARHHSRSAKIRIELLQRDDHVHIAVRDWGIGFNPAGVGKGRFGLQGMRERVRLLGGQVTIETAPDKGTVVSAELPLIEPAAKLSEP